MSSFLRNGRKIVAIGRNYANHIKELGNTTPKEPFFFLKPTTSYLVSGGQVEIPKGIIVHHEVELGVVIGKKGRDISPSNADSFISGYTLAIDMTARNLQEVVKKQGLPWSAVKGFDTFTPIGDFLPKEAVGDPHNLKLWLKINGAIKQEGSTADMIFRIPRLIEHVSSIMTLEEGDLLLTGTPAGVGPISAGDEISVGLESSTGGGLAELNFKAVNRQGGYSFSP
ncbi:hypothetical protein FRB94_004228 [Tulasnella sp. JGI-2019a]|nr:hypothetical protein FRB93_000230 [Tulasnella sp. JGI-2019a]KAG9015109.1 hypothetical protein FRB94_004228 [Tulasnella sp. JGI-2019a]KAG9039179.1 hypothetical protein FRB95_011764 [Tulasnella sp. JGI-2019a]